MPKDLDDKKKWDLLLDVLWNINSSIGRHEGNASVTRPLGELQAFHSGERKYKKKSKAHLRAAKEGM